MASGRARFSMRCGAHHSGGAGSRRARAAAAGAASSAANSGVEGLFPRRPGRRCWRRSSALPARSRSSSAAGRGRRPRRRRRRRADGAVDRDGAVRRAAQPARAHADQCRVVDAGCGTAGHDRRGAGGFPAAVGAFLLAGLLIVLAGIWRPLGRWVAAIRRRLPMPCWPALLLSLCHCPVKAVATPALGAAGVLVWGDRRGASSACTRCRGGRGRGGLIARRRICPPTRWGAVAATAAGRAHIQLAAMVGIAVPLFIVPWPRRTSRMAVLNVERVPAGARPAVPRDRLVLAPGGPFGGHR